MTFSLKIIIASTRPERKGPFVAKWITGIAEKHPEFETEVLDLKEINLPFLDEPEHPRLQKYTQAHSKEWSAKIEPADAFIVVTPEYNFGYIAPLKNALDFLFHEWSYKPMAFVSYGGIAAGTRAVQMLKQVASAFSIIPVPASVNIPSFRKYLDENNNFNADEPLEKSAAKMLKELAEWAEMLKTMRANRKADRNKMKV